MVSPLYTELSMVDNLPIDMYQLSIIDRYHVLILPCGANKRCCSVPSLRAIIKLVLDIRGQDTLLKFFVLQKLNMYGTLVPVSL